MKTDLTYSPKWIKRCNAIIKVTCHSSKWKKIKYGLFFRVSTHLDVRSFFVPFALFVT